MAVNDPTANFGWNIPNVGADIGAWGSILNAALAEDGGSGVPGIDAVLGDVQDLAEAALPKAGGSISGNLVVDGSLTGNGPVRVANNLELTGGSIISLGSGNNNNIATDAAFQRLTTHSSGSTITGFAGGANGKMIVVSIRGSGDLTLANISSASTTANRISLPNGVNQTLPSTTLPRALVFYYDFGNWVLGI